MSNARTVARGLVAVVIAGVVSVPGTASAVSAPAVVAASCSAAPIDKDSSPFVRAALGFRLRAGGSTACAAVGEVQPGDLLNYYCYTVAAGGTWTFLRDERSRAVGWAPDANLPANGSRVSCGF